MSVDYNKVDRVLTDLTAQQSSATGSWDSNKTTLYTKTG